MSELLVIKNVAREGPGLLEGVLRRFGVAYDLKDLDAGEEFPDPSSYKAVIVLGGPDSANDTTPKMMTELDQVRMVLAKDIPYLGICLGMQVLVRAAGGRVVKSPEKEIGFVDAEGKQYTVGLTEAGHSDPLFAGLDDVLDVFQLHGETVELSGDIQLLATGRQCHNQIVRVGEKAYGIQSHFELTPELLAVLGAQDADLQPLGLPALREGFEAIRENYTRIGETLFTNFLHLAGI